MYPIGSFLTASSAFSHVTAAGRIGQKHTTCVLKTYETCTPDLTTLSTFSSVSTNKAFSGTNMWNAISLVDKNHDTVKGFSSVSDRFI